MNWVVIGTLAGVVMGVALEYGFQSSSHRRERQEAIADRLRAERLEAYAALISTAQNCAHDFATAAVHDYGPPAFGSTRRAFSASRKSATGCSRSTASLTQGSERGARLLGHAASDAQNQRVFARLKASP